MAHHPWAPPVIGGSPRRAALPRRGTEEVLEGRPNPTNMPTGPLIPAGPLRRWFLVAIVGLAVALWSGPLVAAPLLAQGTPPCVATRPDALGPFYKPDAPVRASVGRGHVLKGVVRAAAGCQPIAGARIEFWLAGPSGQYDDDHRATVFSDPTGMYRFESNFPPGYGGRSPHIHVRVTAERHQTLVTQYYPRANQTDGTFDLVLIPVR